jgi:hypothetical protein
MPKIDPRRQRDITVSQEHQGLYRLSIDGELWSSVEFSPKHNAWCIEDACNKCLGHVAGIHGSRTQGVNGHRHCQSDDPRRPDAQPGAWRMSRRGCGVTDSRWSPYLLWRSTPVSTYGQDRSRSNHRPCALRVEGGLLLAHIVLKGGIGLLRRLVIKSAFCHQSTSPRRVRGNPPDTWSSSALASCRTGVSNPSVNQL